MAHGAAVGIRVFEAEDEPRVLELLQAAFGEWPRYIEGVTAAEFFDWKHRASPFGPSIRLLAEADETIIGFLGLLTWRLKVDGQLRRTIRGVDLAVDPAVRRRGASMALITAAREHFPADTSFGWNNPNEYSRGGVLKSGRRKVNGVPRFVAFGGPLRETLRRMSAGGSRTPERIPIEADTAATVLRDDAALSRLLERTGEPDDRYVTAKDLDYLRWRYGRFEEYRALAANEDGHCRGLAIFRVRRHGRFWVSQVCELLSERGDRRIARGLLGRVRKAAPADVVACAFPSRRQAARCGFVESLQGAALTANPLREDIVPDPTSASSWALSLGDLELL
jgi:GNAT superfamily N-acetyltransferase